MATTIATSPYSWGLELTRMRSQLRYGPVYRAIIPPALSIVKKKVAERGQGDSCFHSFLFTEFVVEYTSEINTKEQTYAFNP